MKKVAIDQKDVIKEWDPERLKQFKDFMMDFFGIEGVNLAMFDQFLKVFKENAEKSAIDDKRQLSHAREPKKKITLMLPNDGRISFNPKMKLGDDIWKSVEGILIEQWLTKEELIKLYPQAKIHEQKTMSKKPFDITKIPNHEDSNGNISYRPSLNRLLNIADPKELEIALSELTVDQYERYRVEKQKFKLKKAKECVFASASFNYIKRRHRAYLWMFRANPSIDIDDKTGTVTIMWCKYAFGKIFIMGEEIREFK